VTRRGKVLAERRAKDRDAPPPSLGGQAVEWMRTYLVHGPGDVQGRAYDPHDDLVLRAWRMLELRPDGRRRWREVVIADVKGSAKSEFGGAWCLTDSLGPVVFDGWDAHGEPVGRPRVSSDVVVLATSLDQADRTTFAAAAFMADPAHCAEALVDDYGPMDVGRGWESCTRIVLPGRGSIEAMPVNDASVEGGKETVIVFEESHLWVTEQAKRLHRRVARNLVKRPDTMGVHLTNWFDPDAGSLLQETVAAAANGGDGVLLLARQLPDAMVPPASVELRDLPDRELRRLLRSSFGSAASFADLDGVMGLIRDPRQPDHESRRYYLNATARAATGGAWVPAAQWDALAEPALELVPGQRVWAGVDSALRNDSAAVAWCGWVDDRLVVRARIWVAPPGGRIPRDQMRQQLRDLGAGFELGSVAFDPRFFEQDATDLEDEGLPMIEVPQSVERMGPVCAGALEVIAGRVLAHDGGAELGAHVLAAQKKYSERGWTLSKLRSGVPIDGCIAMVLAVAEATGGSKDNVDPVSQIFV
jgi:hypothetical protein